MGILWREGSDERPGASKSWPRGGSAAAGDDRGGAARAVAGSLIPAVSRPAAQFLLDYDVIEAFCVAGLAGRAPATRGTYRSVLYRLAAPVHGPPGQRATPFAGAKPPPPYSPAGRAGLAAVAGRPARPAGRCSALAMVVFGIGAGLRPGELVALRGSDVRRRGRQAMVHVSWARRPGGARHLGLCRPRERTGPPRRQRVCVPPRPRPTAATRTSSPTSPGAWQPTRPRPG